MVNFQKQLDILTGALSILDLSYLVSGSATFGILVNIYPVIWEKINQLNAVMNFVAVLVLVYILGLFSWLIGKQFRYFMMNIGAILYYIWERRFFTRKIERKCPWGNAIMMDFEAVFKKNKEVLDFSGSRVEPLLNQSNEVAYSFMWMELDKSEKTECVKRVLYISRFWTFLAMYEGLIFPVLLFSIFLMKGQLDDFLDSDLIGWILLIVLQILVLYLLCKEARKCACTQISEIMNAYYGFFCEKK